MNTDKIGALIKELRTKNGYTQLTLAEKLCVSDKAVSKWETGAGCPDISLIQDIATLFGVGTDELLEGELSVNVQQGGNMKNAMYYVCPECGNIIFAISAAKISCCGRPLESMTPQKADESHKLSFELIENELYFSSTHSQTKNHYISFAALQTADAMIIKKLYPEWDISFRLPRMHGKLLVYCKNDGLYYQNI